MQLSLARSTALENLSFGMERLAHTAFRLLLAFEERIEQRRQRRALRYLDGATLRDLALSAADVEREASKPF